jgi:hypothetical protein
MLQSLPSREQPEAQRDCPPIKCCAVDCPVAVETTGQPRVQLPFPAEMTDSALEAALIHYRGHAGTMTYRSFHAAATWIFSEGDQPLHRVRYREQPEGLFFVCGAGQKSISSPRADVPEPAPERGGTGAAGAQRP